jgi:adenylate cyclase
MARIELVDPESGVTVTTDADAGRLLDVCDEARAPILFSCRSASCGICRVDVEAGADMLDPPEGDELETLRAFDASPSERLACQVRIRAGDGTIRLVATRDR